MTDRTNIELQSRYRGAKFGLAAGDAIGGLKMCEDCRAKDMFAVEGAFSRDRLQR